MHSTKKESKEVFNFHNTLASVPAILTNRSILIDLRNETSVAGTIVEADGYLELLGLYDIF